MLRIQQHIPLAANRARRHVQRDGFVRTNPTIADCPQRFISKFLARQGLQIDALDAYIVKPTANRGVRIIRVRRKI